MSSPIQPVSGVTADGSTRVQPKGTQPTEEAKFQPRETERVDRDAILNALRSTGEKISYGGRVAEFSYNDDLAMVVVKIYSSATQPREVVRQIPPEQFLNFASRYRELLGIMFDEKV